MLIKSKEINFKLFKSYSILTGNDVADARKYIAGYWQKLTRYTPNPKPDENLMALPRPYLVASGEKGNEFDLPELYYWDSFFMAQGLLDEQHKTLVIGILEDLTALFKNFGIIPNATRTYLTGRSQPPFLTSYIFNIYETYDDLGLDWLKDMMSVAEREYKNVWTGKTKPNARLVYKGLSRYYDINYIDDLAEAESGWDMTPRFNRKCLSYLPVDLNSLLFKYEMDFARFYKLIKDQKNADEWRATAERRKATVNQLMWSNIKNMFYDYNYVKEKRGMVNSLATYYPMWAGLANEQQAKLLVKSLRRFEQHGGLATTDAPQLNQYVPGATPMQWSYPNGWAPLHYLVVKGLERYGYYEDAKRIAFKWLKTNLDWFNAHGVFLEKYNVASINKPPAKGLYPSQVGFGWTNAIFERFCQDYIDNSLP
jgi:alpha,alpha-trehalase